MEAYIFINSEPGMVWEIAEAALGIEGIKMVHAVTGQFDVIAYAEFVNMDALGGMIDKLQSLKESSTNPNSGCDATKTRIATVYSVVQRCNRLLSRICV